MRELERVLKGQLERLRRAPASRVPVGNRTCLVENRTGNGSRQPTLLIRLDPPAAPGKTRPGEQDVAWYEGLFAEAGKLAARPVLPHLEGRALQAVVEELQAFGQENPACLVPLLLGSYLARAEQLYRGQDAARAGIYGLALRGLERLMPEAGPSGPTVETPSQGWVNRLVAWALGRDSAGAGPHEQEPPGQACRWAQRRT